jgi:hypothetical protein
MLFSPFLMINNRKIGRYQFHWLAVMSGAPDSTGTGAAFLQRDGVSLMDRSTAVVIVGLKAYL